MSSFKVSRDSVPQHLTSEYAWKLGIIRSRHRCPVHRGLMPASIRPPGTVLLGAEVEQWYTRVPTPGVTEHLTQRGRYTITVEYAAKAVGGAMPGGTEPWRTPCQRRLYMLLPRSPYHPRACQWVQSQRRLTWTCQATHPVLSMSTKSSTLPSWKNVIKQALGAPEAYQV